MHIGKFFEKVASEALGRIIAQTQNEIVEAAISTVWQKVEIEGDLWAKVHDFLYDNATLLSTTPSSLRLEKRRPVVGCSAITYIYKHRPIRYTFRQSKYYLSYLRGFDIKSLLHLSCIYDSRKVAVYRTYTQKREGNLDSDSVEIADGVYGMTPALEALLHDVDQWLKVKDFTKAPWRRGWLLWGPPGNGKTSAVKHVAKKHGINVFNIDVGGSQGFFMAQWSNMTKFVPCIALIEDIDSTFQGRTNVRDPAAGTNFSSLINAIDGVGNSNGILTVVTCNNVAAIDPALGRPRDESLWRQMSTRPGRLDLCVRFDNPDLAAR